VVGPPTNTLIDPAPEYRGGKGSGPSRGAWRNRQTPPVIGGPGLDRGGGSTPPAPSSSRLAEREGAALWTPPAWFDSTAGGTPPTFNEVSNSHHAVAVRTLYCAGLGCGWERL